MASNQKFKNSHGPTVNKQPSRCKELCPMLSRVKYERHVPCSQGAYNVVGWMKQVLTSRRYRHARYTNRSSTIKAPWSPSCWRDPEHVVSSLGGQSMETWLWKMGRVLMREMEGKCLGRRIGRGSSVWLECRWGEGRVAGKNIDGKQSLSKAPRAQFCLKTDTVRGTGN